MLQLDLGLAVRHSKSLHDMILWINAWRLKLSVACTLYLELRSEDQIFQRHFNTSCRRYTLIGLRFGLNYCSTPMYWKVLLLFTSVGWENKILPIDKLALWHNCRGTLTYQGSNPPYHMQYPVHGHCFQCHFRAWGFQDYTFSSFVSSAYITGWSSWSHLCLVSDLNTWDKGHTTDPKV